MQTTVATYLEALARNLERSMHISGLTENALAKASGLSPRTVGNFLRPNNRQSRHTSKSFPSGTLANLIKLAEALGLEPWELLFHSEQGVRARFIDAIEQAYFDRQQADVAEALTAAGNRRAKARGNGAQR